jgi:hypothetical protein
MWFFLVVVIWVLAALAAPEIFPFVWFLTVFIGLATMWKWAR